MKYSRKESSAMWQDMVNQEQIKSYNAQSIHPLHILKGMLSWVAIAVCVPLISLIINSVFPELNDPAQLHILKWVAGTAIVLVVFDVIKTIIRGYK